jgi:hypothetical protein
MPVVIADVGYIVTIHSDLTHGFQAIKIQCAHIMVHHFIHTFSI